LSYSRV